MAIQLSTSVRSARLDAIETEIKSSAILVLFTGAIESSCGATDSGTELAALQLPGDYMGTSLSAAGTGSKTLLGTWTGTGSAAGTIGHFRMKNSAKAAGCHIQGTVTSTGGSGDLKFDAIDVVSGQTINITTFTLTDGNA